MEDFAVSIGILGVVINLIAYGLLSHGSLKAEDARYQWANITGTCFMLVSLTVQWNLPSFIANAAWLLIGIVGLIRIRRRARSA